MQKLLIVIPAQNEEASIVPVVRDLIDNYPQYDYVVVNDDADRCADEILHILSELEEK